MEPVLSSADLDRIEDAAIRILGEIGLQVPNPGILEALSHKAGLQVNGERVTFDRAAILEILPQVKGCAGYDTHVLAGGYASNFMDPATDEIRPGTVEDLISQVKIMEALGVGVVAPIVVMDIQGPMQEIRMERLTHEYARKSYGSSQITHIVSAEAGLEMSELVGRPHGLELWTDSPLKMNGNCLKMAWGLRHLKPKIRIAGMPTIGMSSPLSMFATFAQSVAECLGSMAVMKFAGFDDVSFRIDAFDCYTVDMKSANPLVNGPEYLRMLIISNEIARRYGIKNPPGKCLMTTSQRPDAQAAAEKAGQCMAAALTGADHFMAAGMLGMSESFSPIQLIIDLEIIKFIDAFTRPFELEKDPMIDLLKEVGPGGLFMDQDSTVSGMRDFYWKPDLFVYNALFSWVAEGAKSTTDRAKEVLAAIKVSDEPVVSPEVSAELDRIEKHYSAKLAAL
jgi:trimethylamine--corrinoid protein Co-methyltransferase